MFEALKYISMAISLISVIIFLIVTILRMRAVKIQAKKYSAKRQITDPIIYSVSYISAFLIISVKLIMIIFFRDDIGDKYWLTDLIPSFILIILTRTIGKSVILRAEKTLYFKNLVTEIKDIHHIKKENNKWMLYTKTGTYPLNLTNTSVYKIQEKTGVSVEMEEEKKPKIKIKSEKKKK